MKNKLLNKSFRIGASTLATALALGLTFNTTLTEARESRDPLANVMWVNHFDLLSGDTSDITTTYDSTSSGVGGGLTGLVIQSSSEGDTFPLGGNKVVHMALDLPKQTKIYGVRVCYENSSKASFISQIRLAQVQNPPSSALVKLDDATDLTDPGPVCVNSAKVIPAINSKDGSVLLSLRVNTDDVTDRIVIRALGLFVNP